MLAGFAAFLPTLNEDPVPQTEVFPYRDRLGAGAAGDPRLALRGRRGASSAILTVPEADLQATDVVGDHDGVAADGATASAGRAADRRRAAWSPRSSTAR